MVLENIYVVRHGYRSNWTVDASTGEYNSNIPSPTGIVSDPALTSYGVKQAKELATHLLGLTPPVDKIYSSPFYRCLQTLLPYTDARASRDGDVTITVEPGLGEFYGLARFDHPSPAPIEELHRHFAHLVPVQPTTIVPSQRGESIPQLHDRIAYCLTHLIARADADASRPRTLLICTHAAAMIAIGRALTGRMPEHEGEDDFQCYTCSFSKFVRRPGASDGRAEASWDPQTPDRVPDVGWREGKGVGGGWNCEVNADCSFLRGGEERGWNFDMEAHQAATVPSADI